MLGKNGLIHVDVAVELVIETIISFLTPVLGEHNLIKSEQTEAVVEFVTPVEEWYIRTVVEYQMGSGLKYEHQLIVSPSAYGSMFDPNSYCKVIQSQTWQGELAGEYWVLRSTSDLPALGTSFSLSCSHFIQSVSTLIVGLPKPDSEEWSPHEYIWPL